MIFGFSFSIDKLDELALDNIEGFILNTPSDYKLAGISLLRFNRKHWITFRSIGGTYYNLDSKLKEAMPIGSEDDLREHLKSQLSKNENELLFVVTDQVHHDGSWRRNFECVSRETLVSESTRTVNSTPD